jgi:CheY-like chemotaxis protein
LFAREHARIDLVLVDLVMPVMDGVAAVHAFFRLKPSVRIVAASGDNAGTLLSRAVSAGVNHFLPKPYAAEAMLATIDAALIKAD